MTAVHPRSPGFALVQQILFHVAVSGLALAIAFSLPAVADFVLHQWWPRVSANAKLLLATELALAAALVLLANALGFAWEGVRARRMRDLASLVQVRRDDGRGGAKPLPAAARAARDALIMSVTGFHTFASDRAPFRELLERSFEARVLLLDPFSEGARSRIRSLPDPERARELYLEEIGASIAYLRSLWESGRRVRLKLYQAAPFWSIVVAGEHAWVRYCHDGYPIASQPDYVFALRPEEPTQGLFPPFCAYALDQWNDSGHREYDFATGELVLRDADGAERDRAPFPLALAG
ncbi:MAG: hypothetical protein FIB05_04460 [Betaproteobacteria bacterium]|nr:hypothetical protein [Betaproteobacteria bacterium]PWB62934.1 MAG: hypothetical protein C3F16_05865 [Betaproteobacteria bacterium]